LAIRIAFDMAVVDELLADRLSIEPRTASTRRLTVPPVESSLLDAVIRLVKLLDAPNDIPPLAPLVLREITYRIPMGPQETQLRQIASVGAPTQKIAVLLTAVVLIDTFAEQLQGCQYPVGELTCPKNTLRKLTGAMSKPFSHRR
jgi:hypothetical protein